MPKKPTYEELERRLKEPGKKPTEAGQSEETLRNIIEHSNELFYVHDTEHNLSYVSPTSVDVLGYTPEEMMRKWTELATDNPINELGLEITEKAIRTGEKQKPYYLELKKKSGEAVLLEIDESPIKDRDGQVVGITGAARDVTERKAVENALRDSERFLQNIFNAIQDGLSILDTDLSIVRVNAWMEQMYSNKAPLVGKKCHDVYQDMQGPCPWCPSLTTIQTGETHSAEVPYPNEKAPVGWIDLSAFPLKDDDGNVIGVIEYVKDITRQKKAEEALKEAHDIISRSPAVAFLWQNSEGWPVEFVTDNVVNLFGYTVQDFISGEILYSRTIHPDDLDRVAQEVATRSQDPDRNTIIHEPYRIVTKEGKEKWVEDRTYIRRDRDGGITHYQGIVEDISERKNAEEALRESEENFRILFDGAADTIALLDTKWNIIDLNLRFKEETGYTREEMIGKNVFTCGIITEESAGKSARRLNRLLAGEKWPIFDVEGLARDGALIPYEVRAVPIVKNGEIMAIQAIMRNISERKRADREKKKLEGQLIQAQKMKAIGTLAGGIAHDFNNLLMGILGNASLMLVDMDSGHAGYEHLKNIEQYVQNGVDLTRQLLGFAMGGKYEVKPTDLNELVKKSARMFGRAKKEIRIHGKYQKDIWTVDVDRGQLEQVLLNLYVNAWQAMPAGGDLFLQTRNTVLKEDEVSPYVLKPGQYVQISVTDNGVGMDPMTRERVFDPFFSTKTPGRGTGLGLASAYGIVKNHDGIISVESELGEGTTFHIFLPASTKKIEKDKIVTQEIVTGSETILLVDDEAMIIDIGGEMLRELGYTVITAKSGSEAVQTYRDQKDLIDMVILDMIMPEMGGGETYDRLKTMDPDIKVLLASGYSINGQAKDILGRGCDGFIQKPFNLGTLSQKLREILMARRSGQ